MDDKEINELYMAAKKMMADKILSVSPYPETKWGPDREHPVVFDEDDNPKERKFFEGKGHLKEVYPGITQGMLVNYAVRDALFDPVSQMPSDMKTNYEALAKIMSQKGFSYEKMADKLSEYDIDDFQMDILVEKAYLNSEAFRTRVCRSLGYDSVSSMPRDIKDTYDNIIERAQDSSEYLKIVREIGDQPSFYSHAQELVEKGQKTIEDGEVEEKLIPLYEKSIEEIKMMYPDGKMDPKDGIASVNVYNAKHVGVSVTAHEMAHFLYNKDYVNPGVHEKDNEYKGKTSQFGRNGSPLDNIDKDKVKYNLAYLMNYCGGDSELAMMVYNPKTKEEKELAKEEMDHDNSGFERAADVHGVRMLMFKEGIYNPFDGSDVTPEQVEQFMKAYPESRIFRYWDEKSTQFFLNNIAYNENLRETVGKNILAAIDEDDKEINAMRGNSFGKGGDASSVAAANMAASSFQQIYDENIGKGQQESKGLSV